MIESVLRELTHTKNKLLLFDVATYSLVGIMILAGVIALPHSLWLVVFHDGSVARILAAIMLCVGAGYGVRLVDLFKKRVHYIDSLRALGFSANDAIQAWGYYHMGKYDALSVERAKRTRRRPPSSATPRSAQPLRR